MYVRQHKNQRFKILCEDLSGASASGQYLKTNQNTVTCLEKCPRNTQANICRWLSYFRTASPAEGPHHPLGPVHKWGEANLRVPGQGFWRLQIAMLVLLLLYIVVCVVWYLCNDNNKFFVFLFVYFLIELVKYMIMFVFNTSIMFLLNFIHYWECCMFGRFFIMISVIFVFCHHVSFLLFVIIL